MPPRNGSGRRYLLLVGAVLIISGLFLGPFDYATRYIHFRILTKDKLVSGARTYIQDRVDGRQMACLYAVACDGEKARLELVEDP